MIASHASPRAEFLAGFRAVLPLIIGSIPFGIIFGALAVTGGMSPVTANAMSAFVYAGSAQFVAVGMVTAGVGNWVIILTTLIVNLRHILYATTLAPHVKHLPQRWLLPLGFWLTDESFIVTIQRYNQPDQSPLKHWFYLGTTIPMYINWQFFTYVGLWAGQAMTLNEILLVAGMALVTFAMRYPVLALVSKITLPPTLRAALKFIPPAVLTAIIVPALLAPKDQTLDFSLTNDYLIAGIVTALVAWRTKNLLLTLAIGMAALWGWRLFIAWATFL